MKLEKDTWYWASHPNEGDIFYPVYIASNGYVVMDGKHNPPEVMDDLNYSKAIMPAT